MNTWNGDVPDACDICGEPITTGFGDARIPEDLGGNGHTWGIVCPRHALLCHFGEGRGQYYERRGERFQKVKAVSETKNS